MTEILKRKTDHIDLVLKQRDPAKLTDLLDQYAMTPHGLHCLLQIYLARAEK